MNFFFFFFRCVVVVTGQHFINEVRSAFGSGTMLQELYITPNFLTPSQWDALAESILWARSQMDTLVDSHWVGADPANGEVYGWAAWRQQSEEARCVAVENQKCNSERQSCECKCRCSFSCELRLGA